DYALDDINQLYPRAESSQISQLLYVRHPPLHIFKTRLVSFVVSDQLNCRSTVGQPLNQCGQIANANLFRVADVENVASRLGDIGKEHQRYNHVTYVGKTARLLAAPEYRNRFTAERLFDEPGQHHSIPTRLARTGRIKQACNGYREFFGTEISQRQELVDRLGTRIPPAALGRGPINGVVIFRKWMLIALPVNLGSGCQQAGLVVAGGQRKNVV